MTNEIWAILLIVFSVGCLILYGFLFLRRSGERKIEVLQNIGKIVVYRRLARFLAFLPSLIGLFLYILSQRYNYQPNYLGWIIVILICLGPLIFYYLFFKKPMTEVINETKQIDPIGGKTLQFVAGYSDKPIKSFACLLIAVPVGAFAFVALLILVLEHIYK